MPPRRPFKTLLPVLLPAILFLVGGCNPFAPSLEEGDPFDDLLGNPATVEGFFANFQNAYELRDIALYEPLLDSAFVFVYYDYDAQVERQWGFAEEIASTRRLFQNASLVRLRWNQILSQSIFDGGKQARVVRPFDLTIAIEGAEPLRSDGNVNFLLVRPDSTAAWVLTRWRDESEL